MIDTLLCTEQLANEDGFPHVDVCSGLPPSPSGSPSAGRTPAERLEVEWLDDSVRQLLGTRLTNSASEPERRIEYLLQLLTWGYANAHDLQATISKHPRSSLAPLVLVVEVDQPTREVVLVDTGHAARKMDAWLQKDTRGRVARVWPAALHKWTQHMSADGAPPYPSCKMHTSISPGFASPVFWESQLEEIMSIAPYEREYQVLMASMLKNYALAYFQLTKADMTSVEDELRERVAAQKHIADAEVDAYRQECERSKAEVTRMHERLELREDELSEMVERHEARLERQYAERTAELEAQYAERAAELEQRHAARMAETDEHARTLASGYKARFEKGRAELAKRVLQQVQPVRERLLHQERQLHEDAESLRQDQARIAAYHARVGEYHRLLIGGTVPREPAAPPVLFEREPPRDLLCDMLADYDAQAVATGTLLRPLSPIGVPAFSTDFSDIDWSGLSAGDDPFQSAQVDSFLA